MVIPTPTPGNYGLTTTPATEYKLVKSGGLGLETRKSQQQDGSQVTKVVVTSTRGAYIDGKEQDDLRVLHPLQDCGDFRGDGLLESYEPSDCDTPLQKQVKAARLVRIEVIVLMLYTGKNAGHVIEASHLVSLLPRYTCVGHRSHCPDALYKDSWAHTHARMCAHTRRSHVCDLQWDPPRLRGVR